MHARSRRWTGSSMPSGGPTSTPTGSAATWLRRPTGSPATTPPARPTWSGCTAACTCRRRFSTKPGVWRRGQRSAEPEHRLDQVDLAKVAVDVGHGHRGEIDPRRQTALAAHGVVVLWATRHLGTKARRLVLGVARIVVLGVRNVVEDRFLPFPQPAH